MFVMVLDYQFYVQYPRIIPGIIQFRVRCPFIFWLLLTIDCPAKRCMAGIFQCSALASAWGKDAHPATRNSNIRVLTRRRAGGKYINSFSS
jgi:hypothetical protein